MCIICYMYICYYYMYRLLYVLAYCIVYLSCIFSKVICYYMYIMFRVLVQSVCHGMLCYIVLCYVMLLYVVVGCLVLRISVPSLTLCHSMHLLTPTPQLV